LEPTAVRADGELIEDEAKRLIVRRHRYSPEVASVVGSDWAERAEPIHKLVSASAEEDAVAQELADVWLHPKGSSPHSGGASLFPWTLAKAFLSSPPALVESCRQRIAKLSPTLPDQAAEVEALQRLQSLAESATTAKGGKYGALVEHLTTIGVGKSKPTRAVVFAERIATLGWLADQLRRDLGFPDDAVRILHGGLSDQEQQAIIEEFKQQGSAVRVLVTGDVASEGVNLHLQCHQLIHFDIPWSLIRIEQRNGRIDRYGQKHRPQITTLLLEPSHPTFSGDLRVLTKLLEKEQEAHRALGDSASLMGKYDVEAEEKEIRKVLAGQAELDDVVATPEEVAKASDVMGLLARLQAASNTTKHAATSVTSSSATAASLYAAEVDFLEDALVQAYTTPDASPSAGGVAYRRHDQEQIVEFQPPRDLLARLDVLPQTYLAEREVSKRLRLATTKAKGKALLAAALADGGGSSWPEAHYLGPIHPVIDWASDRALATLSRNEVFALRADVERPTVLLLGTLTNKRGLTVSSVWVSVTFLNPDNPSSAIVEVHDTALHMLAEVGATRKLTNPGPVADPSRLTSLIPHAVGEARRRMTDQFDAVHADAEAKVDAWTNRVNQWSHEAEALIQRTEIKTRRVSVEDEKRLAAGRAPDRQLVRPLLVVVPVDHPVAEHAPPAEGEDL
jgi:superfamily II DNA/RNA helicase